MIAARWPAVTLALLLASLVLCGGCGPERPHREGDPTLDARISVSPTPAQVGPAGITVRASDRGSPLAEGARVRLLGLGPDGDSVGPLPAHPANGVHGPVTLTLPRPGRWRIEVSVETPDGRATTVRHPLQVVAPASN